MTTLTKKQINWLNKCIKDGTYRRTKGTWTLNPKTGLVDVDGGFDCTNQGLKGFKGVKFGVVTGSFYCYDNQLTSLEGAPQEVVGFNCSNNSLTSLEGAPQEVVGFDCSNNSLTSLEGAPHKVGESFSCEYNRLTSLEGAPQKVGRSFNCSNNSLTSLVGAPIKVSGNFSCYDNRLTSLVGAPQNVGVDFWCYNNQLTSLVGAPQKIGGYFDCSKNSLTSLEGATPNVRLGLFISWGNPVSAKTLITMFSKMKKGDSFWVVATSLKNKMSKKDWKLITRHIPEDIRPGVSMLAQFGLFK